MSAAACFFWHAERMMVSEQEQIKIRREKILFGRKKRRKKNKLV